MKRLTHPLLLITAAAALNSCSREQIPPAPPPPEVATVTVGTRPILLTTELPGRTSPYLIAEIRPQVNGLVQKRLFTEGSEVQAGQDLYQIDPAPFQAALENALAALGRAEANLPAIESRAKRFQEALADNAVSEQDFEDANAALHQARAEVAYGKAVVTTARIHLAYARVTSPISGRIGRSTVTDGAIVTAYQPVALTTVQQLDPIYVDVTQSANELLRWHRRLEQGLLSHCATEVKGVQLILGDGTPYALEGTLQFRDISVDPTTGSVILRLVFPNPDGLLLPGMFVRAVLKEGVNSAAILVPQQAVARDPKGKPLVLLVNAAGAVEQRQVVLERTLGDQWLVSAGLAPGDRVIVEGMQKVRPGLAVKQVPWAAAPRPETPGRSPL